MVTKKESEEMAERTRAKESAEIVGMYLRVASKICDELKIEKSEALLIAFLSEAAGHCHHLMELSK